MIFFNLLWGRKNFLNMQAVRRHRRTWESKGSMETSFGQNHTHQELVFCGFWHVQVLFWWSILCILRQFCAKMVENHYYTGGNARFAKCTLILHPTQRSKRLSPHLYITFRIFNQCVTSFQKLNVQLVYTAAMGKCNFPTVPFTIKVCKGHCCIIVGSSDPYLNPQQASSLKIGDS